MGVETGPDSEDMNFEAPETGSLEIGRLEEDIAVSEMEGTERQKQAWELEKESAEIDRRMRETQSQRTLQSHQERYQSGYNETTMRTRDEAAKRTYKDLESQKKEIQSELYKVTKPMAPREFFDYTLKVARSEKLVEDPELAQEAANSVKGLRDKSRKMLARAERLSEDPSKSFEARSLTHKALGLEFRAGGKEERMLADHRKGL